MQVLSVDDVEQLHRSIEESGYAVIPGVVSRD